MKKIVFLAVAILAVFCGCTSDDESGSQSNYYTEKAQQLAQSYGHFYERNSSAPPMTKEEYEGLERMLNRLNEQFKDTIFLELVKITDSVMVFSNAPYGKDVKTRAESASASSKYQGVTFTVSMLMDGKKYPLSYGVDSDSLEIVGVYLGNETTSLEGNIKTFQTNIRVVCTGGGSYLHLSFKLKGSFDIKSGKGSLSVSSGK